LLVMCDFVSHCLSPRYGHDHAARHICDNARNDQKVKALGYDELALLSPLLLVGPSAELPAPPFYQPVGRQRRSTSGLLNRDSRDCRHSVRTAPRSEHPRRYRWPLVFVRNGGSAGFQKAASHRSTVIKKIRRQACAFLRFGGDCRVSIGYIPAYWYSSRI
jgi:hypothetical protein